MTQKPVRPKGVALPSAGVTAAHAGSALIVLGMHRSGTSLLAHILQLFGADMAHQLEIKNEYNAKGYWERYEITNLHDAILAELKSPWGSLAHTFPLPERWWRFPEIAEQKATLRDFAARMYAERSGLWGFKDPRTSRLLPIWTEILGELEVKPKFVLAIRHPASSAASCIVRDGFSERYAQLLWLTYNLEAVLNGDGGIEAVVDYDDWFTRPVDLLRNIVSALGLPSQFSDDEAERVIGATLSRTLRHNRPEDRRAAPAICLQVYEHLRNYSDPAARNALMGIGREFFAARDNLAGWSEGAMRLSEAVDDASHRNAELAQKVASAEQGRIEMAAHAGGVAQSLEVMTEKFAAVQAERDAARGRLEAGEAKTATLTADCKVLQVRVAELTEKLEDAKTEALLRKSEDEASLAEALTRAEEREAQLGAAQAVAKDLSSRLDARSSEIESTSRARDAALSELDAARAARNEAQSELVAAKLLQATAEAALTEARSHAEALDRKRIRAVQSLEENNLARIELSRELKKANLALKKGADKAGDLSRTLEAARSELAAANRSVEGGSVALREAEDRLRSRDDLLRRAMEDTRRLQQERDELALELADLKSVGQDDATASPPHGDEPPPRTLPGPARDHVRARLRSPGQTKFVARDARAGDVEISTIVNAFALNAPRFGKFDSDFYRRKYKDVLAETGDPLVHYDNSGKSDGYFPNGMAANFGKKALSLVPSMLSASRIFDAKFYMSRNLDVAKSGVEPYRHYLIYGAAEGRDPSPFIVSGSYAEINHETASPRLNPLIHYVLNERHGAADTGGVFDNQYYRAQNAAAIPAGMSALEHFIHHGLGDGLRPSLKIDPLVFLRDEELCFEPFARAALLMSRAEAAVADMDRLVFKSFPRPKVSIIVYARDNASSVMCCLAGLQRTPPSMPFEVLIADDASHDLLPILVNWRAQRLVNVRHVRNHSAPNFKTAINRAAAEARGSIIVLIDGDAEVLDGSIETLIAPFDDDVTAAVSGRLVDPSGAQRAPSEAATGLRPADFVLTEFAALRTEAFLAAGGLGAGPWSADGGELAQRLAEDRWAVVFEPAAAAVHFSDRSIGGAPAAPAGSHPSTAGSNRRLGGPAPLALVPRSANTTAGRTGLSPPPTDAPGKADILSVLFMGAESEAPALGTPPGDVSHQLVAFPRPTTAQRSEGSSPGRGWFEEVKAQALRASGEIVVLLDSGVAPSPGWQKEMIDTFARDPFIGAVGGVLVDQSGVIVSAGGLVWRDGSLTFPGVGENADHVDFAYLRAVDQAPWRFAAVRRDLLLSIDLGGFYAGGDFAMAALGFCVRERGYRTVVQPFAKAVALTPRSIVDEQEVLRSRRLGDLRRLPKNDGAPNADLRAATGRALVVEQSVPRPDKDAGSLLTFEFLNILLKLGYEPSFVPENKLKHAGRYTSDLQRIGIRVVYEPYYNNLWEFGRAHCASMDFLFLFRAPDVEHYLRILEPFRGGARVLVHTQDIHHIREFREAELLGSAERRAEAERTKVRELGGIRAADATIVVSEYEATYLRDLVPDEKIVVAPLIVELMGRQAGFPDLKDICFIGGFKHAPNVDAVKYFVGEIWPLVCTRLPDVRFRVMGSDAPKEIKKLASDRIVIDGFVPDLVTSLARCRVSVAPLRYGAGIKGKIASSLSFGVPCVATESALEGAGFGAEDGVVSASGAEAFADAIVRLYTDPALWTTQSDGGLRFVARTYSREAVGATTAEILASIGLPINVGGRPSPFGDYRDASIGARKPRKKRTPARISR